MGKVSEWLKNTFSKPAPMTGGNKFQVREKLLAQKELDIATMLDVTKTISSEVTKGVDILNERFQGSNYELWRLLLQEMNYWTNRFPVIVSSNMLQNVIFLATKVAFLYGRSAVYKVGDRYVACYIQKSVMNWDGTWKELILRPAHIIFAKSSQSNYDMENPTFTKGEDYWIVRGSNFENLAIYEWDTLNTSAWYRLLPYLLQKESLLKLLNTYRFALFKNLEFNVDSPDTFQKEMELYFNENIPFKIRAGASEGLTNRFKITDNTTEVGSGTLTIIQYIEYWEKTWFKILGRRTNIDSKRERNLTSEINVSQSAMDTLENDEYIHFVMFLRELSRLTGLEIRTAKDKEFNSAYRSVIDFEEEEEDNEI